MPLLAALENSICALILLICSMNTCVLVTDDSNFQTEVLNALKLVPTELPKIFRAECSVEMQLKRTDNFFDRSRLEFEVARKGSDRTLQKSNRFNGKPPVLLARNETYVFALNQVQDRYSLVYLERMKADGILDQIQRATSESEPRQALMSAITLCGRPLSEFVGSPRFQLQNVRRVDETDSRLIRVEFTFDFDPNEEYSFGLDHSFFISDSSQNWCITEYELNAIERKERNRVRYRGKHDGITVIEGVPLVSYAKLEEGDPVIKRVIWKNKIYGNSVDSEQFYLSHYGMPEPNFESDRQRLYLWYALAGMGCILVGIAIRRRMIRR